MSQHLSTTDIDRYRSKAITADEAQLLDSHLAECEECRRIFRDSGRVDAAYGLVRRSLKSVSPSAETHLTYEEMAAYVDDTLDATDHDVIETHMKICADCEGDVTALIKLREAIRSDERDVVAVSHPAVPFWQSTAYRIGFGALAVLLITVGVLWFSTRQIKSLRAENERLRKSLSDSEAIIAGLEHRLDSLATERPGASTPSRPQVTVKLNDGDGIVTMDAEGDLQGLEPLTEQYRRAVRQVLETGQAILPPVVAQLRGGTEKIMAGNTGE